MKTPTETKFYNLLKLFQGKFPPCGVVRFGKEGGTHADRADRGEKNQSPKRSSALSHSSFSLETGYSLMDGFLKFNRTWVFFSICSVCFILFLGKPAFVLAQAGESSFKQREEKLKGFRERKNRFFREDPRSPLKEADRKGFKGLVYYPIDLRYAMTGSIEKYPVEPKPIYATLPTNKEAGKKYVKYGRFKFKLDGREYALQIYRSLASDDLFLPFKDKTSGTETYAKGRYLYIEPMPGGEVLIDFNRAYNPFCQYNEKYTCPFAPEENWLGIAIRAGEKRFQ